MGCRLGAKQSVLSTYLKDATDVGTRIITNATVQVVTGGGDIDSSVTAQRLQFRLGHARSSRLERQSATASRRVTS